MNWATALNDTYLNLDKVEYIYISFNGTTYDVIASWNANSISLNLKEFATHADAITYIDALLSPAP